MKLSFFGAGLLAVSVSASASTQQRTRALLKTARRIEDAGDDAGNADDFNIENYVSDYSIKFMSCHQDQRMGYDDNDDLQYGAVVFRLCPASSCSSECGSGYAEFAVSLSSYVAYYMEAQGGGDAYDADNIGNCGQYEEMFSSGCVPCANFDKNGNAAVNEMCTGLYDDARYKCEQWDIQHFYYNAQTEVNRFGVDTTGCQSIAYMDRKPEGFSEWVSIILLSLLVIGSIAGAVAYTIWWRKKKLTLEKIDDDEEEGDHEYEQHEDGYDDEDAPPKDPTNWTTI